MSFTVLLLTSIGLAMDACAVSMSIGMANCNLKTSQSIKISSSFGLFQGLMPIVGYTIARTFSSYIEKIDHWVIFVILTLVGLNMVIEGFSKKPSTSFNDPTKWHNLLSLSLATSIDALAVGAALAFYDKTGVLEPWWGYLASSAVIAVITVLTCFIAVRLGCKFGEKLGKKAEVFGGAILILIAVKTLLEHTIFN